MNISNNNKSSMWIGVDFGTYKSCIGYWTNNNFEIITDECYDRSFLNILNVCDNKLQVSKYRTSNSIHSVKRLLLSNIIDNNNLYYLIKALFKHIINIAENKVRKKVTGIVLSVPDHFNQLQRRTLAQCCNSIGVNVRLLHDSVCALLCYNHYNIGKSMDDEYILLYNVGAANVTASVAKVDTKDNTYYIVDTISFDIGADDCEYIIATYLKNIYSIEDGKASNALINSCKEAKHILSTINTATIEVKFDGTQYKLTTDRFNDICGTLFNKLLHPIRKFSSCYDINKIVMIGCGTRIKYIRNFIENFHEKISVNYSLNADECIAIGTAIHSGILNGDDKLDYIMSINMLHHDISFTTQSGIDNYSPHSVKIFSKGSLFPSRSITKLVIPYPHLEITLTDHGAFKINATHDNQSANVISEIDSDGIISISAYDILSGEQLLVTSNFQD